MWILAFLCLLAFAPGIILGLLVHPFFFPVLLLLMFAPPAFIQPGGPSPQAKESRP